MVGYRLVPHYRYPIQIEDAFKALRHYIKNNETNNGIVVGGYSAGAEISSHLAFDTKRQNETIYLLESGTGRVRTRCNISTTYPISCSDW